MIKRLVILASGEGTNLQNVIDKQGLSLFNINIVGVVSNKDCRAKKRSREKIYSILFYSMGYIKIYNSEQIMINI